MSARVWLLLPLLALFACGPDFRDDIPCDADDNCPEGLFCNEGFCGDRPVRRCLSNLDCPVQQHCDPEIRECVDGRQPSTD